MKMLPICALLISQVIWNVGQCGTLSASSSDNLQQESLGYCAGVFSYVMNAYALSNKAGGVKVMSLQYARAYASYAATVLSAGKRNVDTARQINGSIQAYSQTAKAHLDANLDELAAETDKCSAYVNRVFYQLSDAGFKIDEGYSESLVEFASALAAKVRGDIGFR